MLNLDLRTINKGRRQAIEDPVLKKLRLLFAPACIVLKMAELAVIPIETPTFWMKAAASALPREVTHGSDGGKAIVLCNKLLCLVLYRGLASIF